MANENIIKGIINDAKHPVLITHLSQLFPGNYNLWKDKELKQAKTGAEALSIIDGIIDLAINSGFSVTTALMSLYYNYDVESLIKRDGIDLDKWAYEKLAMLMLVSTEPKTQSKQNEEGKQKENEIDAKELLVNIYKMTTSIFLGKIPSIFTGYESFKHKVSTDSDFASKVQTMYDTMNSKAEADTKNTEWIEKSLTEFYISTGIVPEENRTKFEGFIELAMELGTNNNEKNHRREQQAPAPVDPPKEQPQVAHDLRQSQAQAFNIGNFMQHQQQQMTFDEKVEYIKKHVKLLEGTHPNVNDKWLDAITSMIRGDYLKSKLHEFGSQCKPNNPMLFEIKLENGMDEGGKYNIAFRVNCKDKKNFILVRYSTNPTQMPNGNIGYPIDATLMGA